MMDQLTPRPLDRNLNPFDSHPLLTPTRLPLASPFDSVNLTPLASPARQSFPTTSLSLNAPDFNMQRPPMPRQKTATHNNASNNANVSPTSRGQIHVNLISARALNLTSPNARPYVVVQFEQNEFIGRDPISEPTSKPGSRPASLTSAGGGAIEALGAIANRKPGSRKSSTSSSTNGVALLAKVPHSPVWKCQVSL